MDKAGALIKKIKYFAFCRYLVGILDTSLSIFYSLSVRKCYIDLKQITAVLPGSESKLLPPSLSFAVQLRKK